MKKMWSFMFNALGLGNAALVLNVPFTFDLLLYTCYTRVLLCVIWYVHGLHLYIWLHTDNISKCALPF